MRRLPPNLAPIGYSPRRYAPLSPAPVLDMGQRLTDLREMQLLFANGEQGGYWPSDPAYAFEDSAGTTAASVNGVVGYRTDVALGKHAVQATTGNKPIRRTTPVSNKSWYDSNTATGALTATFSGALGSACTVATVTPEGVTIAENQTVGATYNIAPAYGYDSDVLIINRALTAAEKALVTRVMQRSVPGLGSELITNGQFDSDVTGWTMRSGSSSSVSGEAEITTTSAGGLYQSIECQLNSFYRLTGKIRKGTANISLRIMQGNVTANVIMALTDDVTSTATMTEKSLVASRVSAGTTTLTPYARCPAAGIAYADNISFKAIL